MNKDRRMTIAVISCDNYKDVVGYYLDFVAKNWADCPFDIVVATEELDLKSNTAKTLMCGSNTTWTRRAIDVINSCESKYILLTVDDLYMSEKVDSEEFISILDFMDDHEITYYRIPWHLANNKRYKTHPDNPNVNMIPKDMPYGRSIGSSIWERNELLDLLGDGSMSAWELEEYFSMEAAQNIGGGITNITLQTKDTCFTPSKWFHRGNGRSIPSSGFVSLAMRSTHPNVDFCLPKFI